MEEDIGDVITCFKFGDDWLGGLALADGQILPVPIDFDCRPYNILTMGACDLSPADINSPIIIAIIIIWAQACTLVSL